MSKIGFSEAFGKYGAKLKNAQWSVSAINSENELVVSLWEHHRDKTQKGKLVYTDSFSRWSGPGNSEFRTNVTNAFNSNQNVRVIIVVTEDIKSVQNGRDASILKKTFRVRRDLIGKVTKIDDDNYTISFIRELVSTE